MATRDPRPIRPRIKDARLYELMLRRGYLDPLYTHLVSRLALAAAITDVYRALERGVAEFQARPRAGIPTDRIQEHMDGLARKHRAELIRSFRAALGVNIASLLSEPIVRDFLTQKVAENVGLIKTIPARFHEGLRERMERELAERPFDQQRLKVMLRKEYKSSGYNLRRITRDQTNKTIGQLTEIRHRQAGLDQYQWITAQDERVRPSHNANSGLMFKWDEPPGVTGHPGFDIQCRCVAQPIVTQAQKDRLVQADGAYSLLYPGA